MKKILMMAAGIAAMFSSCSTFTLVNDETYNNADLAEYKTFRIVTPEEGKMPPGMEMVTYYNIAAAIREQMVDRGYTESPTSPMLINIGLSVQKELATEPVLPPNYYPYYGPAPAPRFYPFFMYPRQYYWPAYYQNAQVITGVYREGVLTMDIVNIDTKVPLYSASVATILNGNGNGQFRNLKGIYEAVNTLFSKFPVKVLPQYRSN